ncbi:MULTISPECIES: hypothetical protein [unclassified Microcoleus]|uniref:hypothetical protein n=1 Tax=unclassified Microcoleus TaxID=2642155 RepID=UPI002FD06991
MNVTIKDIELLKNLQPQQISYYLEAKGWKQAQQIDSRAIIWTSSDIKPEAPQIVLPLNSTLPDFPVSMNLMLETLEIIENRSQLEILADLITGIPNTTIQGIVIQIHTPNADKLSGEITFLGVIADKLRKIKTSLADKDYILAIKAYQERLPFLCTGDLIKKNQTFTLKNPRNFTLDDL